MTLGGFCACTGSNFYSIGPLFNFKVASLASSMEKEIVGGEIGEMEKEIGVWETEEEIVDGEIRGTERMMGSMESGYGFSVNRGRLVRRFQDAKIVV